MKINQKLQCWGLGAGLFLAATASLQAGEPTRQLKSTTDKLLAVLENPELKGEDKQTQRREKLGAILRDRFALRQMARLTIRTPDWNQAGKQQQDRFFDLFGRLLERTYLDEIDQYEGQTITFGEENVRGQTATVKSTIKRDEADNLPVTYRVLKRGGEWVIYDVGIDGVSLVRNYRDQFAEILDGADFDALLAKLEDKLAP